MEPSPLTLTLGLAAAALTSLSYLPQAKKALPKGATADLSVRTLTALFIGLSLWVIYGILRSDLVIIIANTVGAALVGFVLVCKLRDLRLT